jgi:hypothetical protein
VQAFLKDIGKFLFLCVSAGSEPILSSSFSFSRIHRNSEFSSSTHLPVTDGNCCQIVTVVYLQSDQGENMGAGGGGGMCQYDRDKKCMHNLIWL